MVKWRLGTTLMAVYHESSSYVVCHDRNADRYFQFMENPAFFLNTVRPGEEMGSEIYCYYELGMEEPLANIHPSVN